MPRSIGAISGKVALSVYRKVMLVEVVVAGTPYRLTDWYTSVTQTIDSVSRTFAPAGIVAGGIGEDVDNGLDDATLTIWNANLAWSTLALTSDGLRASFVSIWEGWFDPVSGAWVDYVELFLGRVSETDFDETSVVLKMVPHNIPWVVKVPGDIFTTTCGLKFKGPQCQYAGADTSCLRTYQDCTSRTGGSNVAHFRGFRFLPDPTKPIEWNEAATTLPTQGG